MINKLDAVCLLVEDLKQSRNFYEKILNLEVSITDTGFVEYKLGETPLALFQKSDATAMFPNKFMKPSGGAVIALKVDDVSSSCEAIKSQGIKIFEGPKTTSWGQTVAYLHDPDGHIIELTG
ncbi:hypothetical protein A3B57_03740 [Microgenomates group bacterium RIFCSPLOWO2_01_FULL_47_10]|nr:MAG: hypothetical protein A3B57_03740 [Microgenomates group bacterium RIFCSPLOWO2_01_FULL_47_10]